MCGSPPDCRTGVPDYIRGLVRDPLCGTREERSLLDRLRTGPKTRLQRGATQPSNVAPKHGLKDVNVTAKTPVAAYAVLTRHLARARRYLEAAAATLARVFREYVIEV